MNFKLVASPSIALLFFAAPRAPPRGAQFWRPAPRAPRCPCQRLHPDAQAQLWKLWADWLARHHYSVGVGAEEDEQNMSLRVSTPTADDLAEAASVLAAEEAETAAATAAAAADTVAA